MAKTPVSQAAAISVFVGLNVAGLDELEKAFAAQPRV